MNWGFLRRKPKPFKPCDQMCPLEIERRIADVEANGPLLFLARRPTEDEIGEYKALVIGHMRAEAATFPPPCQRCPSRKDAK